MKVNKIEVGQCIRVVWLDSAFLNSGWVYDEVLVPHPKEIESVGFVCATADNALMIASSRSGSGGFISPLSIPTGCILDCNIIEF